MSNSVQSPFLALLIVILNSYALYSQESELSNRDFLQGNFAYCDNAPANIIIKGKKMIEEFPGDNKNEIIRIIAKIKWTSNNTYDLIAKKVTGKTPIKKGNVIQVKITRRTDTTLEYHYKFTDGSGLEGFDCFKRIP